MKKIVFAESDLVTSRIGLGTWAMGGWMWGVLTKLSLLQPFTLASIVE
jgi:hypothetical protein